MFLMPSTLLTDVDQQTVRTLLGLLMLLLHTQQGAGKHTSKKKKKSLLDYVLMRLNSE